MHTNHVGLSVLTSLSDTEPSDTVRLVGSGCKVAEFNQVLRRAFKPGILSLLSERSQSFLRIELNVEMFEAQVLEAELAHRTLKATLGIADIKLYLMVADAPYQMMSALFDISKREFTERRKNLPKNVYKRPQGGRLPNLAEEGEKQINHLFVKLSRERNAESGEPWLPGELHLRVYELSHIPIGNIWGYAINSEEWID